jgi:coenzyme F420-reducing hydrogenase beta subunit
MVPDREGFLRPEIDAGACVGCGRCERACPALRPDDPRTPLRVLAARAKDEGLRRSSSSGGVFSLIARRTLERGGVVFGAAFDPSDGAVRHVGAESEEGLVELRGSKYVQSEIGGTYEAALEALKAGRAVLFSGTPCQVAGLRRFLDVAAPELDRSGLLLVDTACHAAPSPLAWRRYLRSRTGGRSRDGVAAVSFRDKASGWHVFSLSIRTKGGGSYRRSIFEDSFMRGFLKELFSRPSCHRCPARSFRSGADVTLADYWSVAKRFPDMDDDRGTSLVLALTERGEREVAAIESQCDVRESDLGHATVGNPVLDRSLAPHPLRKRFFRWVRWVPFDFLVDRILRASAVPARPSNDGEREGT